MLVNDFQNFENGEKDTKAIALTIFSQPLSSAQPFDEKRES